MKQKMTKANKTGYRIADHKGNVPGVEGSAHGLAIGVTCMRVLNKRRIRFCVIYVYIVHVIASRLLWRVHAVSCLHSFPS